MYLFLPFTLWNDRGILILTAWPSGRSCFVSVRQLLLAYNPTPWFIDENLVVQTWVIREYVRYLINTQWPCHCVSRSHSQLKFAVNTMDSVLSSLYPLNIILANLLRLSPSSNNLYMKLFMLSRTWSLISFFQKIYGKNDWCYVFQFVQFVTRIFLLKFSIIFCV